VQLLAAGNPAGSRGSRWCPATRHEGTCAEGVTERAAIGPLAAADGTFPHDAVFVYELARKLAD
jgi:hypothetical protein